MAETSLKENLLDWTGVCKLGTCPVSHEAMHMCCLCYWGDLEGHSLIPLSSIMKEDTFQQWNTILLMICLLSSPACSNLILILDSILSLIPTEPVPLFINIDPLGSCLRFRMTGMFSPREYKDWLVFISAFVLFHLSNPSDAARVLILPLLLSFLSSILGSMDPIIGTTCSPFPCSPWLFPVPFLR